MTPFKLGQAIAAASRDVPTRKLAYDSAFTDALLDDPMCGRTLCKFAAVKLFSGEHAKSTVGIAYNHLADERTPWKSSYRLFCEPVLAAIGRNQMEKKAFIPEMLATSGVGAATGAVPKVLQAALATGVLTGLIGGTGAHFLSRDARQSSAENEELLNKALAYARMRKEIEEDIQHLQKEDPKDGARRHII